MNHLFKRASFLALIAANASAFADQSSPYAGQELRAIKALSQSEIEGLLAGRGMGYAKVAELNGYPGPLHVLELAGELELSVEQRMATQALFDQMQAAARKLGAELVAAERELDELFRGRSIDEASLSRVTAEIGHLAAQLRAVHLQAHLRQTELLSARQIAEYSRLRGYGHEGRRHR